jgi:hypothetical protein
VALVVIGILMVYQVVQVVVAWREGHLTKQVSLVLYLMGTLVVIMIAVLAEVEVRLPQAGMVV